jgi:hypothetical protein
MFVSNMSVELLDVTLGVFKETYSGTHLAAWQYVNTTWMPHKERFVACYIDEFPHFGSASTLRVEGNHHIIKSYLLVDTLHLLTLTKRLGLMLANQRVELNAAIEKQRVHKAHRFGHSCFKDLIYKVSNFALDKLLQQLKTLKRGDMRSSHVLRGSRNRGGCPIIITFAAIWKPRLRFSCKTFMSSGC